ncbi:MAG: GspE/PulE family protein [Woeseiaceae bacterium]|nr:GspE/PulE family protein [Woeseiaceae bacterium]
MAGASTARFTRRKKLRLGEALIEMDAITAEDLENALDEQRRTGQKLGRTLINIGAITEDRLHQCLAHKMEIEFVDLRSIDLDLEAVQELGEVQARRLRAIVLKADERDALVGMSDPTDIVAYDELSRILGRPLRLCLVSETDLLQTLDVVYRRTDEIDEFAAQVKAELAEARLDIDALSVEEDSADAPVIKLLQSLFRDAVQIKASDIHIEPDELCLRIRQRVDGQLQEHVIDGRGVASALVTRLKLMSKLDISEKRLPQDGRFSVTVNNVVLDVRVSTLPTQFGEAVVMRLLDQSANLMGLDKLGMSADLYGRFRRLIDLPGGMVLVTGPTGSGKTTTLYSALNYVNRPSTKIITAEDPVEYQLERINQVQINAGIGLTFARVLRTALRQDPDIILIGEMRDQETADIALRAAMTGHLVFSTLHTQTAVGTASRLFDMGAPGYLVAASLEGIVAQRLIRRVCDSCKEPATLSAGQQAWIDAQAPQHSSTEFLHGRGCNYCHLTGYSGRVGVYELLEMDPGLADALRREDLSEFTRLASAKKSYVPMANCALDYAVAGTSTLDEVIRLAGSVSLYEARHAETRAPAVSAPEAVDADA